MIKDPETYERFEKVVLLHGCRRVAELAYGEMITEKLPNDELIGELVRNQLIYYPTVTRDPFRNRGRITDLINSGKLFADIGLASLDPAHDRVMICGSPALVADTRTLLDGKGFRRRQSRRAGAVRGREGVRGALSGTARPAHPFFAGVVSRSWAGTCGRCRRLHRHARGPRHQIKLQLDQFRRAVIIGLRADAGDAGAQPPLQRSQRLPLQPIDRIAGRMRLRDRRSRELLVPIVVMAIGAAEIELALPLHEQFAPLGDERLKLRIAAGLDRHAARLLRDEGGECQQFAAFVSEAASPADG